MSKPLCFIITLCAFLLVSCKTDFDNFEEKAQEYSKSDSKIISTELDDLQEEVKNFKDGNFRKFFTSGEFDKSKLVEYLKNKGYTIEEENEQLISEKGHKVNVYIENSGSMNGYVSGATEFKEAIRDLLVVLKYRYDEENIKINFINSAIYPTAIHTDLAGFSKNLNTKTFKVGDTNSSDINNIFKQILSKTSENTISILLSDCIYSIQGSKTEELLSDQKSLTKDAFLSKFKTKERVITSLIKLNSSFNGIYFDKDNRKTVLNGEHRPYYMAIMGSDNATNYFNSKIELNREKVSGYQESYTFVFENYSQVMYYSIINTEYDSGRYKSDRDFSDSNSVRGIKDVEIADRNSTNLIVSVAVDLSDIPLDSSYILNKNNYTIKNSNYKIKGIFPFVEKDIKPNSLRMLTNAKAKPTHYIVFESLTPSVSDLTFILKKQIPSWVDETNTNDDSKIKDNLNKTFGIKYLFEGIHEAYGLESGNSNYLELTIKIKK